jgi:hypothetical protein
VTTSRVDPAFVPRDIANPNKKKGFRNAMIGQTATRVVFDDAARGEGTVAGAAAAEEEKAPSPPATPVRVTQPTQPVRRKFVPPSEMESLPSNVFVTSREFAFKKDEERRRADERAAKLAAKAAKAAEPKPQRQTRAQARRASPVYEADVEMEEEGWSPEDIAAAKLFAWAEKSFDSLPLAQALQVGQVAAYKVSSVLLYPADTRRLSST